jgi:hypothetical protein
MASFLDVVRFNPVSSGTGSFVVSSAVNGYQTPASAGAVNGATYRYRAESADLTQWEVGFGVYTVGTTTLTRSTILFNSSGGTSAINFTLVPQVAIVALAEDLTALVGVVRIQKFTSSGTYTPNAFMLYCTIECLGAGGGGAGCQNSVSGQNSGGGGGGGSYSRITVTKATIGASQTATIGTAGSPGLTTTPWTGGAGGDTSVGTICIGKGGSGGGSSSGNLGLGGLGGVAGTGDITGTGQPGGAGISSALTTISVPSAFGGSSVWGGGGQQMVGNASSTGTSGTGFGSGGGGGVAFSNGGAASGGLATAGLIVITEYCSQ